MNSQQIDLVQSTFRLVEPVAEDAARLFYARLFELDPELRRLFPHDLAGQGRKLMTALGLVVRGLRAPEVILPVARDLGRRHRGYGVRDEHYAVVGDALLWTLERGLGDAFTPEVRAAWGAAYTLLSGEMRAAGAPGPSLPMMQGIR
ncbi:globin family protein [Deinococcus sonorensis]|uniref:Globin family protein n=2 Tax=Deinococcus sonorensis TaxID=309891 RepID=A0AAU7U6G8_9DEIO